MASDFECLIVIGLFWLYVREGTIKIILGPKGSSLKTALKYLMELWESALKSWASETAESGLENLQDSLPVGFICYLLG